MPSSQIIGIVLLATIQGESETVQQSISVPAMKQPRCRKIKQAPSPNSIASRFEVSGLRKHLINRGDIYMQLLHLQWLFDPLDKIEHRKMFAPIFMLIPPLATLIVDYLSHQHFTYKTPFIP